MRYNPNIDPDPDWWHSLTREEKVNSVLDSHSALWDELKVNGRLHAIAHVTVEDLLASGRNSPVRTTLRNLMAQGLTRHTGYSCNSHRHSRTNYRRNARR